MKKADTFNILFCGLGGQGVLRASEVCGLAALLDGFHVKKSEVHGMAQRGGFVESHLRFGKIVFSPLIPRGEADFLVCFYKDERSHVKNFLKPKGKDLTDYLEKAEASVADKKYLNTFLLGILARHLPISKESWLEAIESIFREKNLAENKKIFLQGLASA